MVWHCVSGCACRLIIKHEHYVRQQDIKHLRCHIVPGIDDTEVLKSFTCRLPDLNHKQVAADNNCSFIGAYFRYAVAGTFQTGCSIHHIVSYSLGFGSQNSAVPVLPTLCQVQVSVLELLPILYLYTVQIMHMFVFIPKSTRRSSAVSLSFNVLFHWSGKQHPEITPTAAISVWQTGHFLI